MIESGGTVDPGALGRRGGGGRRRPVGRDPRRPARGRGAVAVADRPADVAPPAPASCCRRRTGPRSACGPASGRRQRARRLLPQRHGDGPPGARAGRRRADRHRRQRRARADGPAAARPSRTSSAPGPCSPRSTRRRATRAPCCSPEAAAARAAFVAARPLLVEHLLASTSGRQLVAMGLGRRRPRRRRPRRHRPRRPTRRRRVHRRLIRTDVLSRVRRDSAAALGRRRSARRPMSRAIAATVASRSSSWASMTLRGLAEQLEADEPEQLGPRGEHGARARRRGASTSSGGAGPVEVGPQGRRDGARARSAADRSSRPGGRRRRCRRAPASPATPGRWCRRARRSPGTGEP